MAPVSETHSIITLTTDFGMQDPFVGSMKGAILQINPDARIIDISHQIDTFDLFDASFLVSCSYKYFPPGTIHCIVVDPGVGSERRPILAVSERYMFVAPDNGVLSHIYEQEAITRVIHIRESKYFLVNISQTFHGRDIFAPVCAWLSKGIAPMETGPEIFDYIRLELPKSYVSEDGKSIYGQVIYIDHFGNLLTNIEYNLIEKAFRGDMSRFRALIEGALIERFCYAYTDLERGNIGAIAGSQGYLELFASKDSLSKRLGIVKGAKVEVFLE